MSTQTASNVQKSVGSWNLGKGILMGHEKEEEESDDDDTEEEEVVDRAAHCQSVTNPQSQFTVNPFGIDHNAAGNSPDDDAP